MSRSLPTILTALLLSWTSLAAPASPADEAAVLVQQGHRLVEAGRPEVALGLYRAALLLTPDAAEPHLGVARVLRAQGRCEEAVPEYRAWMSLVPQPPSSPELYTQAVVELGECLRQSAAVLEVQSPRAMSCSDDGGTSRPVGPGAPVTFELSAGQHVVSCGNDIIAPLSLTAGARKVLRIDPAGRLVSLVRFRSDPAAQCSLDGDTAFLVPPEGSTWLVAPGEHRLDCTRDDEPPASRSLTVEVAAELDVVLTAAPRVSPGDEPWPPSTEPTDLPPPPLPPPDTEPEPVPPPPSIVHPSARAEVEIRTEGAGWTCRLGDLVRTPSVAGEIFVELDPGDYTLDCEQPASLPVSQPFNVDAGERLVIEVVRTPRPTPTLAPQPPAKHRSTVTGGVEWMFGAGLGPALGTFGLAAGARMDAWSLQVGTGVNPLALSVSYHLKPGENGLYVTGGWSRVGNGLLRADDVPAGHQLHSGAGVEIRFDDRFLVRLGAGLALATNGFNSGPLTFDLSAFWLP